MKKISILIIVAIIICSLVFMFRKKSNNSSIILNANTLIKNRQSSNLSEIQKIEFHQEKINTFCIFKNEIIILTQENNIYNLYTKKKLNINCEKETSFNDIFAYNNSIYVFYKSRINGNGIIEFDCLNNKPKSKVILDKSVFRVKKINDSILVLDNSKDTTQFLELYNSKSKQKLMRINMSNYYNITNTDMINQGVFSTDCINNKKSILYTNRKSSHIFKFYTDSSKENKTFNTIDSTVFPKIAYNSSSSNNIEMVETILIPNLNVNFCVSTDSKNNVFILSNINKNSNEGRYIDIYNEDTLNYIKSLFIPNINTKTKPIIFQLNDNKNEIIVLYSDKNTFVIYKY